MITKIGRECFGQMLTSSVKMDTIKLSTKVLTNLLDTSTLEDGSYTIATIPINENGYSWYYDSLNNTVNIIVEAFKTLSGLEKVNYRSIGVYCTIDGVKKLFATSKYSIDLTNSNNAYVSYKFNFTI